MISGIERPITIESVKLTESFDAKDTAGRAQTRVQARLKLRLELDPSKDLKPLPFGLARVVKAMIAVAGEVEDGEKCTDTLKSNRKFPTYQYTFSISDRASKKKHVFEIVGVAKLAPQFKTVSGVAQLSWSIDGDIEVGDARWLAMMIGDATEAKVSCRELQIEIDFEDAEDATEDATEATAN